MESWMIKYELMEVFENIHIEINTKMQSSAVKTWSLAEGKKHVMLSFSIALCVIT